jgi:flagellar basal body-associated protein FliL
MSDSTENLPENHESANPAGENAAAASATVESVAAETTTVSKEQKSKAESGQGSSSGAEAAGNSGSTKELSEVDRAFAAVDPGFVEELRTVQEAAQHSPNSAGHDAHAVSTAQNSAVDRDIDQAVVEAKREAALRGWRGWFYKLIRSPLKRFSIWIVVLCIAGSRFFVGSIAKLVKLSKLIFLRALRWLKTDGLEHAKGGLKRALSAVKTVAGLFMALSIWQKLSLFAALGLAVATTVVIQFIVKGRQLPSMQTVFLSSFADIADKRYEFSETEKWQSFDNPLLHPEHTVLIERLIVNLQAARQSSNSSSDAKPMLLVDLYVECSSSAAAIEVKDRESEVRDLFARSIEKMVYDDLITLEGKNKLKLILRKNVNVILTKGRVRQILFGNLVLKP